MKYTYEIKKDTMGNEIILRSDGAFIPMDTANADYREYLNPSETNEPTDK